MRYVFGALTLCILLVGGYMAWQNSTSAPQEETGLSGNGTVGSAAPGDTYDIQVTFTGEAYEPKIVIIEKGTRVRFYNDSDEETWPASAIHPTHSIYPESRTTDCLGSSFDSCRGLKKGEYFDFTFHHPGTWRFHDHIHAYKTGEVIVKE